MTMSKKMKWVSEAASRLSRIRNHPYQDIGGFLVEPSTFPTSDNDQGKS
jgi:hypothetical protein